MRICSLIVEREEGGEEEEERERKRGEGDGGGRETPIPCLPYVP